MVIDISTAITNNKNEEIRQFIEEFSLTYDVEQLKEEYFKAQNQVGLILSNKSALSIVQQAALLYQVSLCGFKDLSRKLIAKGVALNQVNVSSKLTALEVARKHGHADIVAQLERALNNSLSKAIASGDSNLILELVLAGAKIDKNTHYEIIQRYILDKEDISALKLLSILGGVSMRLDIDIYHKVDSTKKLQDHKVASTQQQDMLLSVFLLLVNSSYEDSFNYAKKRIKDVYRNFSELKFSDMKPVKDAYNIIKEQGLPARITAKRVLSRYIIPDPDQAIDIESLTKDMQKIARIFTEFKIDKNFVLELISCSKQSTREQKEELLDRKLLDCAISKLEQISKAPSNIISSLVGKYLPESSSQRKFSDKLIQQICDREKTELTSEEIAEGLESEISFLDRIRKSSKLDVTKSKIAKVAR